MVTRSEAHAGADQPAKEEAAILGVSEPVVAEIVRRLVPALEPERIYLFGSRARGDATEDSDYDIMVVVRERVGAGPAMEIEAQRALAGLGVPKDVVVMTRTRFDWLRGARASLPATVEREGRLLYAA